MEKSLSIDARLQKNNIFIDISGICRAHLFRFLLEELSSQQARGYILFSFTAESLLSITPRYCYWWYWLFVGSWIVWEYPCSSVARFFLLPPASIKKATQRSGT